MTGTQSILTTSLTSTVAAPQPDRSDDLRRKRHAVQRPRTSGEAPLQLTNRDARGVAQVRAEVAKPDGSRETGTRQLIAGDALNGQYRAPFSIPTNGSGRTQRDSFVLTAGDAAGNRRRVKKQVMVNR